MDIFNLSKKMYGLKIKKKYVSIDLDCFKPSSRSNKFVLLSYAFIKSTGYFKEQMKVVLPI